MNKNKTIKRVFQILCVGFFLTNFVLAASDNLSVYLGGNTQPSQLINAGEKKVRVYDFQIKNNETSTLTTGATITQIKIESSAFPQGQILRYKLWANGNNIGTVALPNSKEINFDKLTVTIPAGTSQDFFLTADISFQDNVQGQFHYQITEIQTLLGVAEIEGAVPKSNKISIGKDTEASVIISADCNFREEPVCGADGKTYFNRCLAFQKGLDVLYEGICREQDLDTNNLWNCSGTAEPICGIDGKTYTNQCYLNRAEISEDYKGACFPENFSFPSTYREAYDLFLLKKNQLTQIRPRISERSAKDLEEIAQTMLMYDFLEETRPEIIKNIGNFILFAQNFSDRSTLESEIILLKRVLIQAKQKTRSARYEAGSIPFLDADKEEWFTPAVTFLKEKGWVSGYLDKEGNNTGLFKPSDSVTKAEITKMVFQVASISPEASLSGPKNSYARNHWAKNYIDKAEKSGFTLWEEDINPEKKASRIEVLQLLFEAFGMQPQLRFSEKDKLFTDIAKEADVAPFVYYGQFLDIIDGYPDGTFQPEKTVSRAEAAKIIERAFYKIPRADHLQVSPIEGSPHFTSSKDISFSSSEEDYKEATTDFSDFPEAEIPETTVINPQITEQMRRYAVPYISPNYHFYMDVPGLYRFQAFEAQENEIMRFGFAKNPMITEFDVDFWLKIIATSAPLKTDRYTPSIESIQWDFPRTKSDNTFFRLEGPESQLEAMEMLKDSIQYSNPEDIPSE